MAISTGIFNPQRTRDEYEYEMRKQREYERMCAMTNAYASPFSQTEQEAPKKAPKPSHLNQKLLLIKG